MKINGFSANNRAVLEKYAGKIAKEFNVGTTQKTNSIWDLFCQYLPSPASAGKKLGEKMAATHGQRWSNSLIDFVADKIFQDDVKPASSWSFDVFKQGAKGAAHKSFAESMKLCITPQMLPILTAFCGVSGQVALPLLLSFVNFVYKRAMNDPEALKKLGTLPLEELFTIDAETMQLRDGFGNLLTFEDMNDIYQGTAEYTLIGQLIELCHEIDTQASEDAPIFAKELFKKLVKSYHIKRSDGVVVYPDGTLRTEAEKKVVEEGVAILGRNNPRQHKKEVRRLIKLLATHSILPFLNLSVRDLEVKGVPKKMPHVFSNDENEWKNYIMRGEDGIYLVYQDCDPKKRGDIISALEMQNIMKEIAQKQNPPIC
ncbi:MAG: hypothetical protein LW832_07895 [Parachlamydia sp.]|jgi:hypothetical protein|nr:hypothetical protein [Parachlamydia sp.]